MKYISKIMNEQIKLNQQLKTNIGELTSPVYDVEQAERGLKEGKIILEIVGEINNQEAVDEQIRQNKIEEVLTAEYNKQHQELTKKMAKE